MSELILNSPTAQINLKYTGSENKEFDLEALEFIESGSNANGSYTKFPDGTLIQRHTISATTSSGWGWFFPLPFIDINYHVFPTATTHASYVALLSVNIAGLTEARVSGYCSAIIGSGSDNFAIMAIGRWK